MAFSDEDLRLLKEIHADNPKLCMGHISTEELMALLSRLEAGEALEQYWKYYEPMSKEDEKEYNTKVAVWKKSAGK